MAPVLVLILRSRRFLGPALAFAVQVEIHMAGYLCQLGRELCDAHGAEECVHPSAGNAIIIPSCTCLISNAM